MEKKNCIELKLKTKREMRKFAKHGCSEIGRLQRSENCEPVVGRRQARAYCEIGYEKQMEQWLPVG